VKTTKPTSSRFQHSADTPAGKQERAVAVFLDPHGFVQQKWEFLREKGMSDREILEALNTATAGELIRAAGLETLTGRHP
jgi:hypothetical protein